MDLKQGITVQYHVRNPKSCRASTPGCGCASSINQGLRRIVSQRVHGPKLLGRHRSAETFPGFGDPEQGSMDTQEVRVNNVQRRSLSRIWFSFESSLLLITFLTVHELYEALRNGSFSGVICDNEIMMAANGTVGNNGLN